MQSDRLETIFRRDLDRLPGLRDDEWIPSSRRSSPTLRLGHLAALLAAILIMVGVGLSLRAIRNAQPVPESGTATLSDQLFIVSEPGAAPTSVGASGQLSLLCQPGQLPLLDVSHPPPPGTLPGTGAASPEAAFRRAKTEVGEFTLFPFGESQPARGWDDPRLGKGPIWLVAGTETFVVLRIGGPADGGWFAYPARFIQCMSPPSRQRP